MIRLVAPEGYKYYDRVTENRYSVVVIKGKDRDRFTLVPDLDKNIVTY